MNEIEISQIIDFPDRNGNEEVLGFLVDHPSLGPKGVICKTMEEATILKNEILFYKRDPKR